MKEKLKGGGKMPFKKKIIGCLTMSLILVITCVVPLLAQTTTLTETTTTTSTETTTTTTEQTETTTNPTPVNSVQILPRDTSFAQILSDTYGSTVAAEDVAKMRTAQLGYGEIALAYGIASRTGLALNDVLSMRQEGKLGWGQIAREAGDSKGKSKEKGSTGNNKSNSGKGSSGSKGEGNGAGKSGGNGGGKGSGKK